MLAGQRVNVRNVGLLFGATSSGAQRRNGLRLDASDLVCCPSDSYLSCRTAENFSPVPMDEIATAIARCAGCLADGVVTVESIDSGEGEPSITVQQPYVFFDR